MAASDTSVKNYVLEHKLVSENNLGSAQSEADRLHQPLLEVLLSRHLVTADQLKSISTATASQADTPSIERSVNIILEYAVRSRATAIHIEPRGAVSQIRYRIDDVLQDNMSLPANLHAAAVVYIKHRAGLNTEQTRIPQTAQFIEHFDGNPVTFDVATMPTLTGETVVIRVIDEQQTRTDLTDLGMDDEMKKKVDSFLARSQGLGLVTSPHAADTTLVLYSLLRHFDTSAFNIATIENPVVQNLPGINQTTTDPIHGLNFATLVSATLRQDVNILMVSELIDKITAELVADGALSGKLMLAGLHASDSIAAMVRVNDMGVEPFLIASTVRLIIATRRVRKLCQVCRRRYIPNGEELTRIRDHLGEMPKPARKVFDSNHNDSSASHVHKKVIAAPTRLELARKSILDLIAHDPNLIYRSLADAEARQQPAEAAPPPPPANPANADISFYQAVGCAKCGGTGYLGQINIFEVLSVNDTLVAAIAAGQTARELRELALQNGFVPLAKDGLNKAARGITTIAEILRVL